MNLISLIGIRLSRFIISSMPVLVRCIFEGICPFHLSCLMYDVKLQIIFVILLMYMGSTVICPLYFLIFCNLCSSFVFPNQSNNGFINFVGLIQESAFGFVNFLYCLFSISLIFSLYYFLHLFSLVFFAVVFLVS